ncbi:MAG: hypothetical protein JSW40_08540 [Candidatus Omnitrophota bacterium]|nr:MAG: hypothetical protein JSW40_08540 [Candidatus Omnitrophota bacterium]
MMNVENKKSILREWIEAAVIAFIIVTFVRLFFFQLYKIPTSSMIPTLRPKDKIFVSKLAYGPKMPPLVNYVSQVFENQSEGK